MATLPTISSDYRYLMNHVSTVTTTKIDRVINTVVDNPLTTKLVESSQSAPSTRRKFVEMRHNIKDVQFIYI